MTVQRSEAVRNAQANAVEDTISTSPHLRIRTGSKPANCAASRTGTILVNIELPSDWLTAASGGTKSKSGTWSVAAIESGTAGHYEIMSADELTCHEQGTVTQQVELTTNALTAANSNVLNFASTTGVATGMNITGLGIPAGATVLAFTGTTVTMSHASASGVPDAEIISFGGDMTIQNTSINSGQTVTVTSYQFTVPGA